MFSDFTIQEKLKTLEKLDKTIAMKLVWGWMKANDISFKQFVILSDAIYNKSP